MAQLSNSWRKQIADRISGLPGMSQAVLAALAGMTPNRLSGFIVGRQALENAELTQLYDLLVKCEELAEIAKPIPVDYRNLLALQDALESLRLGDLRPVRKHAGETSVA